MRCRGLLLALVLMVSACGRGATPVAGHTNPPSASSALSASAEPTPSPPASASPAASPSGGASPAPQSQATVTCTARPTGGPMVLLGKPPFMQALYEVTDPLRPRLLCRISNTSAHIFTGDTIVYLRSASTTTDLVMHSLGSGNETVISSIPRAGLEAQAFGPVAWFPDGTLAAAAIPPADPNAGDQTQVWLWSQYYKGLVYSYPYPLTDCICRFGLTGPTLAFSPDRQYFVSGWPIGKGSAPFAVFRVSDHAQLGVLDARTTFVMWDRNGHRLFTFGPSGAQAWTPEGGTVALTGAKSWQFLPGVSPDGSGVAYTGYTDPQNPVAGTLRVYVYDLATNTTRVLVDQSRSQVVFVKDGWVWYLDEPACDPSAPDCGPWGSAPSGKVFAMNLSTGMEQQVTFAAGEAPSPGVGYGFTFAPGEFWPNS